MIGYQYAKNILQTALFPIKMFLYPYTALRNYMLLKMMNPRLNVLPILLLLTK